MKKFLFSEFIFILTLLVFFLACSDSSSELGKDETPDEDPSSSVKIDTILPSSAYIGDTVLIKGKNFGSEISAVEVSFTGSLATVLSVSDNEIHVIVPLEASSSSGIVYVTVNGEEARTDFGFGIIQPPFDLYSMTPREGSAGQIISISGYGLPADITKVSARFGSINSEVLKVSGSEIQVLVPYDASSGRFILEIDGYLTLAPNSFTYISGGKWERLGAFGDPATSGMSGFVLDGKIYVGLGFQYEHLQVFYQYNPESDAFTEITSFPGEGRSGAFSFSYDGKGYVGGGYTGYYAGYPTYASDFYKYDPLTNSWTKLSDFPGAERDQAIAFILGDRAYVGLGRSLDSDFWSYDFTMDQWVQLPDFPGAPRKGAGAFVIENKAYVYGGLGNGVLNDLWVFDSDQWTQLSSPDTEGQANMVTFSLNGKGYMACGWDYEGYTVTSKMRQSHEFDPGTNTWKRISNFYDPEISYSIALTVSGKAYLFSGLYTKYYYRFTPD